MNLRRIGTIGFATAIFAGALAFTSPAKADWHHGHGHWGYHGGPHVWVRPWAPPVYYAPPPVYYAPPPAYYAPPPVVYAPPPVYYPPAVSIGVRLP